MIEDHQGHQGAGGERRFFAKPKFCQFCADKTLTIDYKKTDLLRKYITEDGKIRPRRQTGACARHQRVVAAADQAGSPDCPAALRWQITRRGTLIAEDVCGAWLNSMPRLFFMEK